MICYHFVTKTLGVIHSITTTPANAHDTAQLSDLLHRVENTVWGDTGYRGAGKRSGLRAAEVDWLLCQSPGVRKTLKGIAARVEKAKAQVRAKAERIFLIIKQQFGYSKVRYRGLTINTNRLYVLAGFAHLLTCKKFLLT